MPGLWRSASAPAASPTLAQRRVEDGRPLVLVTLLCAPESVRARAVAFHARRRGHRPVFVVTDPDIASIRAAGFVAEHLPAPDVVHGVAACGDWRIYLTQRWATIRAKWAPDVVLTEALSFEDYLRKCAISDKVPVMTSGD